MASIALRGSAALPHVQYGCHDCHESGEAQGQANLSALRGQPEQHAADFEDQPADEEQYDGERGVFKARAYLLPAEYR